MSSPKNEIAALLERLPENVSLENIQYHIYVIEKVNKGIESAEKGQTLTQEQAEKRLAHFF